MAQRARDFWRRSCQRGCWLTAAELTTLFSLGQVCFRVDLIILSSDLIKECFSSSREYVDSYGLANVPTPSRALPSRLRVVRAPHGALLQPATRVALLLPVCRASQTASGGHVHITNPPPRASLPTWQ